MSGVPPALRAAPPTYHYDLFISHSPADALWVEQWLIPQLTAADLVVCTEHSAFELGLPRLDNLERVVDQSRHILLVLSPAWVQSEWNAVEALLTQTLDPAARQRRLLPLMLYSCQPPRRIAQLAAADFRNLEHWDEQLQRLIATVRGTPCAADLPLALARGPALSSDQHLRNRSRMLDKVHDFWVRGVLDSSRQNAALIALGLEFVPEAVAHPWRMLVQQPQQPQRTVPAGTRISAVFDSLHGELLILGEPGSGKTTLLLELTHDLLGRAQSDPHHPIPVVFTLSTWAEQRRPLSDWLVDELNARYDVPQQVGQTWIENEQILPLLDGLDEVQAEHRCACLEAINQFRREHGLVHLVVCSRLVDYNDLETQLRLGGAVLVQPLTLDQIDECLASAGNRLLGLRQALREHPALQELATSPLLLNIMILTYQGQTIAAPPSSSTTDAWQTHLFAAYVDAMFARRSVDSRYGREQTLHWLSWLARTMQRQSQTVFFIERLQPGWLPTRAASWAYLLLDRLGLGLLFGLGYWLLLGSILALRHQGHLFADGRAAGLTVALIVGLFGSGRTTLTLAQLPFGRLTAHGLLGGLVTGLAYVAYSRIGHGLSDLVPFSMSSILAGTLLSDLVPFFMSGTLAGTLMNRPSLLPRTITVIERLRWSWSKMARAASVMLIFSLIQSLLWQLSATQSEGLGQDLFDGLGLALISVLLTVLLFGMVGDEIDSRTTANEGIRRSARSALLIGFSFGSLLWIISGQASALMSGLIAALGFGGSACLSHYTLRFVLWRSGAIPLRYASFLDYTAERIFLRKVGGGYIFVHRRLLDYFAALADDHRR